jgi:NAD(P)-dependent dehydrogenase (short-subunit alcohol dehydrogenase family)
MKLPALKQIRSQSSPTSDPGRDRRLHRADLPLRRARHAAGAARHGIELPPLTQLREKLWDYWERTLDPTLPRTALRGRGQRQDRSSSPAPSSGIGRAAALKIAAAGGIPILVARTQEKLDEAKAEIEAAGGTAYVYSCDLSDFDAIEALVEKLLADHPRIDMLVNNAGRSIRRSVALSYDRFHDYERTVRLNYLSPVKLMLGLLPHMRDQGGGHIVNVSSIGVQTNPPRFSAYVGSKAALDAFTRVTSSETIGDNVTFTTIHMPLVRTPMIAPTKMYDSFPTISPDEAADLVCEAIRAKPKQINTQLGHVRRGRLRARAEGGRPDPAHGLPRLPGVDGREGREGDRPRARRRPARRRRSRT